MGQERVDGSSSHFGQCVTSLRFVAALLSFGMIACGPIATTGVSSGRVAPGADAEQAYATGIQAFRQDNCLDAEPTFRRVRREFPFSRFAALSELRVADCKFKQGQFAEAITAYRQFIRFRPSHSQIEYARFRVAESHYAQIPSEWIFSPPTHERDRQATQEALRQLRRYSLDYPENERRADMVGMVQRCLDVLAAHELFAAKFYLRRGAYPAVVNRLQTLLRTYEGSRLDAEALLLLGETYERLADNIRARSAYETLLERFPDSDEARDARVAITTL